MKEIEFFERNIVTGLLKDYNAKAIMVKFTKDYFTTKEMRALFIIAKEHYNKYGQMPDAEIVVNEMSKRTSANIDELNKMRMFIEKAGDSGLDEGKFNYAIQEVEKQFMSRRLKDSMRIAIDLIDKGKPLEAQDTILKNIIEISTSGRDVVMVDFVEAFKERKGNLIKRKENPSLLRDLCIPTGIEEIDAELDGGLRKGELGLWLAAPEGGKSISLQNIAINAASEGYSVALFTIEMTPEQTAYRLDSALTGLDYRKLRRSTVNEEEMEYWEGKVKSIPPNRLKIIGVPEGCTCRLIEAEMQKIKSMFVPDIILVDYAGIMSPNDGKFSSSMDWKYVGEIIKNLKGLALKLHVPIWSASQLLVGAKEKSDVSFVDIGLARQQIAAHADVCIAIIRTAQMELMSQSKLQFVKAREGVTKKSITVITNYDKIRLSTDRVKPGTAGESVAEVEEAPF